MGPSDAVRSVLSNYTNFSGRASRSEYWWWILALIGLQIVIFVISLITPEIGLLLSVVVFFGVIIPGLAVAVRRLHDTGRSGWWLLVAFIPLVGALILLIFLLLDSDQQANQWGPPPLGSGYYMGAE